MVAVLIMCYACVRMASHICTSVNTKSSTYILSLVGEFYQVMLGSRCDQLLTWTWRPLK